MQTKELSVITKETQKAVLKTLCEYPVLTVEELTLTLKNTGKNISQDEILQVLHSISPDKNWHRASEEDVHKEVLDYLWTLENQILFLLPTKQKETTIAEFNQLRLQNKQTKVPKEIIRHLQTLLYVDGKNLIKFRKFEKDLSIQDDLEVNIQAAWSVRLVLGSISTDSIISVQEFSALLVNQFKERLPLLGEKVGKTIQRICEKFTEKYFPKNISDAKLKELVNLYQAIHNTYKRGGDGDLSNKSEFSDQNKIIQKITEELEDVKEIVTESHEGGFLSKLFMGKVKNKEGVIKKVDSAIELLSQITNLSSLAGKASSEKLLFVKKIQSEYENIVLVKSQLENDLYNLSEKVKEFEEKNINLEKDHQDKSESLERAHEKIAMLQQKIDQIPELESRSNMLREELNTAKDIAMRLYRRIMKLKTDLLNKTQEKSKNNKISSEQKNNNNSQPVHKVTPVTETVQAT